MLVLNTTWTRAADIPCSPSDRHSFHSTVLLAGFGFRPGSIVNFPYKHVQLAVVRDPKDRTRRTLAALITIAHNKQKTGKVYHSQDEMYGCPPESPFSGLRTLTCRAVKHLLLHYLGAVSDYMSSYPHHLSRACRRRL